MRTAPLELPSVSAPVPGVIQLLVVIAATRAPFHGDTQTSHTALTHFWAITPFYRINLYAVMPNN
jgi:hypothetical protein